MREYNSNDEICTFHIISNTLKLNGAISKLYIIKLIKEDIKMSHIL